MISTPHALKRLLNIYPPYLGAGIRIKHVSKDWKELQVAMPLRWYNRNAVNTQFGGSLYSMADPHVMLMLMQLLGRNYLVWDKAAEIDFIKPGKGKVTSDIKISDEDIDDIKRNTSDGGKYFPEFLIDINDEAGDLVARVKKTLYVKRKS